MSSDALKLSPAQVRAVNFLRANHGLTVPNMNLHGRSKEWPTRATLNALLRKGVIDFEQDQYGWTVRLTAAWNTRQGTDHAE